MIICIFYYMSVSISYVLSFVLLTHVREHFVRIVVNREHFVCCPNTGTCRTHLLVFMSVDDFCAH